MAPCGKPYRTQGGNKKPCVFPYSDVSTKPLHEMVQNSAQFQMDPTKPRCNDSSQRSSRGRGGDTQAVQSSTLVLQTVIVCTFEMESPHKTEWRSVKSTHSWNDRPPRSTVSPVTGSLLFAAWCVVPARWRCLSTLEYPFVSGKRAFEHGRLAMGYANVRDQCNDLSYPVLFTAESYNVQ